MRIVVVCTDAEVPVPGTHARSVELVGLVRGFRAANHPTFLLGVTGTALPALDGPVMLVGNPGVVRGEAAREARDRQTSERALGRGMDVVTRFSPDLVYEKLAAFGDAGRRLARRTGSQHVVEVDRPLTTGAGTAVAHEREVLAEADAIVVTDAALVDEVRAAVPDGFITVVPPADGAWEDRARAIIDRLSETRLQAG